MARSHGRGCTGPGSVFARVRGANIRWGEACTLRGMQGAHVFAWGAGSISHQMLCPGRALTRLHPEEHLA